MLIILFWINANFIHPKWIRFKRLLMLLNFIYLQGIKEGFSEKPAKKNWNPRGNFIIYIYIYIYIAF